VTRTDTQSTYLRAPDTLGHLQAISLQEAAKRLGIATRTLYRMMDRGEISVVRYASRTRVPITELERLLTPTPRATLTYQEARAADTND